jgi:hypothetical protein
MNKIRSLFAPLLKTLADSMPRKVMISCFVLAGTLLMTLILVPTVGGLHGDILDTNTHLKTSIKKLSDNLATAKDDHQFLVDNHERYDALISSDRLIPHTRTVAMTQMQKLAIVRGLTTLNYNFKLQGEGGQSTEKVMGGYRLHSEVVELKIGAPLDTQIYDFVTDLGESFPGAAVVEEVKLERAPALTTEALNAVSSGQESGLVKGEMTFAWRTAQAQEPDSSKAKSDKPKAKK